MRAQKKFMVVMSLSSFLSAIFIGGLTTLLIVNDGPLSLVSNTLAGIKLCIGAISVQCSFIMVLNWMHKPSDSDGRSTISFFSQVLNVLKFVGVLFLATLVFHGIAVCFGAPFFESTSRTYHFAVLLAVQVCLPFCLFMGPDLDAWFKVFQSQSRDEALELVVYLTSIGSVLGAWLGAVPIPLDWDRPWQEWPISCVTGGLLGYAGGLLLSSICIPRQQKAGHKSKFF